MKYSITLFNSKLFNSIIK